MSDPAQAPMLAAALAAYDAGLCVVRTAVDGTKKPLGTWLEYQSNRPSRETVAAWFADGYPGMGVICGAVSGDLEMFELEGRFMAKHAQAFLDRIKDAGLELLFKRLQTGYHAGSPSSGRHFIYHVDGPIEGNTKLATTLVADATLKPDGDPKYPTGFRIDTLIETRGEGGFVVLAPSHGPVHPTGKPWKIKGGGIADIVTISTAERAALFEVARSFDEAPVTPPPPPHPVQPVKVAVWTGQRSSESWMDQVVEHLTATQTVLSVLVGYGWEECYTDKHGRQLVRRPGKDDSGVSGSINTNGRLMPFSTSTPFPTGRKQTFDVLDVIAYYEHHGERVEAARSIGERCGILRPPAGAQPVDDGAGVTDDVWKSRSVLVQIRTAARSRLVSPSAVLGAVLARVAAFTPPSTCIPAMIGSTIPLSLYMALRGSSGAGKSAPNGAAADLFPATPPGCIGPLGLGSGEGLVEAFMQLIEETDGAGKKRKVKKQVFHGVLFDLDEGQFLAEVGNRKGATILPVLRTAWSGGDPGQANASVETRRSLHRGSYAVGLVSLWQDHAAALLLADFEGGTPQRFTWFETDDPDAGDAGIPDWPGEIAWEPPPMYSVPSPLDVDSTIIKEIRLARIADLRGGYVHPLDAHRRLNKLKIAGVLAVLENRHDLTVDDWELAERIMSDSDATRSKIITAANSATAGVEAAALRKAIARDAASEGAGVDRALDRAARAVARKAHRSTGPIGKRELHHSIASRDRQIVTVDEAIARAEGFAWLVPVLDGWAAGKAKPT